MGSKGHCTIVFSSVLLFLCGIMAIIAVATTWWTSDNGSTEFTLWEMKFEYGADNKISAKHSDMCKNAQGVLATYCSKINAARATCIITSIFGVAQAVLLLCLYCGPRIWVLITCLTLGVITFGSAMSAMILGIQLAADNSLINSPGAGFIMISIAMAFALVGYILNLVGSCLGPKGGGGGCGKCCDCGEGSSGSAYGGHQRFRDRPPVSGGGAPGSGGWQMRQPVGMRPPMRPPMQPNPQMIPYQVPVPVAVPAQQPPPQQINLNIRAVGPPQSGAAYGSQPLPAAPPVVYSQQPPPSGNDDFGLNRRV